MWLQTRQKTVTTSSLTSTRRTTTKQRQMNAVANVECRIGARWVTCKRPSGVWLNLLRLRPQHLPGSMRKLSSAKTRRLFNYILHPHPVSFRTRVRQPTMAHETLLPDPSLSPVGNAISLQTRSELKGVICLMWRLNLEKRTGKRFSAVTNACHWTTGDPM